MWCNKCMMDHLGGKCQKDNVLGHLEPFILDEPQPLMPPPYPSGFMPGEYWDWKNAWGMYLGDLQRRREKKLF